MNKAEVWKKFVNVPHDGSDIIKIDHGIPIEELKFGSLLFLSNSEIDPDKEAGFYRLIKFTSKSLTLDRLIDKEYQTINFIIYRDAIVYPPDKEMSASGRSHWWSDTKSRTRPEKPLQIGSGSFGTKGLICKNYSHPDKGIYRLIKDKIKEIKSRR